MELSADIGPRRAAFLDLEYAASAAYNGFVYRDRAQADAVRAMLFDKGAAEFAPAFGRIAADGDQTVGMIVCLPAPELSKCRMRSAYALARSDFFAEDPGLAERMALAGRSLMRLASDDFYLSRIAVAASAAGRGYGALLLDHCTAAAAEAGAPRIALEVAAENEGAAAFYRKHGFRELDRLAVADPATERTLTYVHMAKPLAR